MHELLHDAQAYEGLSRIVQDMLSFWHAHLSRRLHASIVANVKAQQVHQSAATLQHCSGLCQWLHAPACLLAASMPTTCLCMHLHHGMSCSTAQVVLCDDSVAHMATDCYASHGWTASQYKSHYCLHWQCCACDLRL